MCFIVSRNLTTTKNMNLYNDATKHDILIQFLLDNWIIAILVILAGIVTAIPQLRDGIKLIITWFKSLLHKEQLTEIPIYNSITKSKSCGIKGIYYNERASDRIKEKLSKIEELKIIAVSGTNMLKSLESDLVTLLTQNHAEIKILVGNPYSDFIKDVEACESYDPILQSNTGLRADMISQEIEHAIKNINICIEKAISKQKKENKGVMGKLVLKHFNTQMRSSIIIINDEWAWLTLNLPPAKALNSLSIEFYRRDKDSYINDIVKHFNALFQLSTDCKEVKKCEITYK